MSTALVATRPIVVFSPARGPRPRINGPARSTLRMSTNVLPSSPRAPATTCPVAGSITSPTALTATIAATTRPSESLIDALPSPPFTGRPVILPTVAPAPAPTLPSSTGPSLAATEAL